LNALSVQDQFNVVLAREDVECPKPDPEIYRLAAQRLEEHVDECLVVEDSPIGVQAAVDAGMHCIGVATPFTREGLHTQQGLAQEWIVDDPATLPAVVERLIEQ
jgi:beta-phosphoglucomutase-like phosphatase (HAD superfamily)